MCESCLSDDTM